MATPEGKYHAHHLRWNCFFSSVCLRMEVVIVKGEETSQDQLKRVWRLEAGDGVAGSSSSDLWPPRNIQIG